MNTLRCNICNKVNSVHIETNAGDFLRGNKQRFFPDTDKKRSGFICHECNDSIKDTLYEYHIYDEAKKEKLKL